MKKRKNLNALYFKAKLYKKSYLYKKYFSLFHWIIINSNIFDSNKYKTERKVLKKIKIIKDKEEFKNFYINEKGVIVFKEKDNPITSIQIVNSKPKLSKYSNELKVFGKKKNISIYEVPPPTTKVIVRPIKI